MIDASRSRYVRVAVEAIRAQIRSGALKSGSVLPPETGLAQTLELSRGTVRRAIEVLIEAGELSRKPYSRPRVEATKAVRTALGTQVHVWISHPIADEATLQFLRGISNGLKGTSFRLVVREPSRFFAEFVKTEEREFLTELLNDDSVSSAIIERDADASNDDLYRLAVERGKHLVFVDLPPPVGLAADYVGTANLSASRRCVEHLVQLGHSRIVYATESSTPTTVKHRINGYWRGLKLAGIESEGRVLVASELEPAEDTRMPTQGAYAQGLSVSTYYKDRSNRLIQQILEMSPRPTAIMASCDVLAHWICAGIEARGFSVPGDFAVIGFDWLARWDEPSMDIITTASQDFEGFGYHAAELLLDRVDQGHSHSADDREARQLLLPAALMVRRSTMGEVALPSSQRAEEPRSRVQHFR